MYTANCDVLQEGCYRAPTAISSTNYQVRVALIIMMKDQSIDRVIESDTNWANASSVRPCKTVLRLLPYCHTERGPCLLQCWWMESISLVVMFSAAYFSYRAHRIWNQWYLVYAPQPQADGIFGIENRVHFSIYERELKLNRSKLPRFRLNPYCSVDTTLVWWCTPLYFLPIKSSNYAQDRWHVLLQDLLSSVSPWIYLGAETAGPMHIVPSSSWSSGCTGIGRGIHKTAFGSTNPIHPWYPWYSYYWMAYCIMKLGFFSWHNYNNYIIVVTMRDLKGWPESTMKMYTSAWQTT